jgi:7-keto-8-aminopelargonate synthetase-like enzyme
MAFAELLSWETIKNRLFIILTTPCVPPRPLLPPFLAHAARASISCLLARRAPLLHRSVTMPLFVILCLMLWILLSRQTTSKKRRTGLSEAELNELIAEWEPDPLVRWPPPLGHARACPSCFPPPPPPSHPPALTHPQPNPCPPIPQVSPEEAAAPAAVVPWVLSGFSGGGGGPSMRVRVEGDAAEKTLWTSSDFLGLGADAGVRAESTRALEKFTVGSCGPRGFYGTTTAHLELEASLARFMGAEESITYSDGVATVASVIPAFAKKGDVLLIDAAANAGIHQGARLSRSKVVWWAHNDTGKLEEHLAAVRRADGANGGRLAREQRRFIVVEGLYARDGSQCPLPEVMRLAKEYRWRVMLDDSMSFGVLGKTGRGSVEHFAFTEDDKPHVVVGSLSTSLGSVGGFCVGPREVVDHQRLSGAGYCFSASAPPYLCASASAALRALEAEPALAVQLQSKAMALHQALERAFAGSGALALASHVLSPVKHLRIAIARSPVAEAEGGGGGGGGGGGFGGGRVEPLQGARGARMLSPTTQKLSAQDLAVARALAKEEALLDALVLSACGKGALVARSHGLASEAFPQRPTLKVAVTLRHSEADVAALVAALKAAVEEVFN